MNPYPAMHAPGSLFPYHLLILILAVIPLCCAAAPIFTVFGDEIPLGGTAPGSTVVYLFLTGPNLPDGGISLAGGTPVTTGVPSSFTRVEVQTDDTWAYTWRTGSTGRILDRGTYVIYIVQEPRARPDLDDTVFATQAVVFGAPVETVTIALPETTGSLPSGTMQGGTLVTGMQPPAPPTPVPPATSPSQVSQIALPALVPLAGAVLAIFGFRRPR
jgi:hypothetical protein